MRVGVGVLALFLLVVFGLRDQSGEPAVVRDDVALLLLVVGIALLATSPSRWIDRSETTYNAFRERYLSRVKRAVEWLDNDDLAQKTRAIEREVWRIGFRFFALLLLLVGVRDIVFSPLGGGWGALALGLERLVGSTVLFVVADAPRLWRAFIAQRPRLIALSPVVMLSAAALAIIPDRKGALAPPFGTIIGAAFLLIAMVMIWHADRHWAEDQSDKVVLVTSCAALGACLLVPSLPRVAPGMHETLALVVPGFIVAFAVEGLWGASTDDAAVNRRTPAVLSVAVICVLFAGEAWAIRGADLRETQDSTVRPEAFALIVTAAFLIGSRGVSWFGERSEASEK